MIFNGSTEDRGHFGLDQATKNGNAQMAKACSLFKRHSPRGRAVRRRPYHGGEVGGKMENQPALHARISPFPRQNIIHVHLRYTHGYYRACNFRAKRARNVLELLA